MKMTCSLVAHLLFCYCFYIDELQILEHIEKMKQQGEIKRKPNKDIGDTNSKKEQVKKLENKQNTKKQCFIDVTRNC